MSSCGQVDIIFPMLYVAGYNELEQLHMQMYCHLAAFLELYTKAGKSQFNNNCMYNSSVFIIASYI